MILMLIGSYVHSSLTYVHPMTYREITEAERSEVRKWNKAHGLQRYVTIQDVGTYFERDDKIVWVKRDDMEAVRRWMKNRRSSEIQKRLGPRL